MKLHHRVLCFVAFFFASAASFNGFYSECHFGEEGVPRAWYPAGFERMVNGTADRPYVYRQLLPTFANWVDDVAPRFVKTRVYGRMMARNQNWEYWSVVLASSPASVSQQYYFRYFFIYLATFLFALTGTYAMYLVCLAMEVPLPVAVLAPTVMILLLPYFMSFNGKIYDYPELAFFALAVWVTAKYKWYWAIPIAALGAWNKESFFFIIPTLYPFMRRRNSRTAALVGITFLLLICGLIYIFLRIRYQHNPGSTVLFKLVDHIRYFLQPRAILSGTQEVYGLRVPRVFSIFPIALLVWAIWRTWRQFPEAVREHAKIAALINIPLYFLFCVPGEIRDLSMLYIALLFVIALNLDEWFRNARLQVPNADHETA